MVLNISDTESLSEEEGEMKDVQMVDEIGFGVTSRIECSTHIGDDVASSSGSNLRSSFIGMGFSPHLIDKVIREKGEDDPEMLLDTLFAYTVDQKLNSESSQSLEPHLNETQNKSLLGCPAECHLDQAAQIAKSTSLDSFDSLLDDEKDPEPITASMDFHPKQEADFVDDLHDDRRATLLMMKFSLKEVDFAISKLGKGALINELVDFIVAAQLAESDHTDELLNGDRVEKKNEDSHTEALFGTMDKTLQLLKMGFNEHDVSMAIEKLGSAVPMTELANWICASQMGECYPTKSKHASMSSMAKHSANGLWFHHKGRPSVYDEFAVKTEPGLDYPLADFHEGIKPKEEFYDDSSSVMRDFNIDDIKGKRPKEELEDDFTIYDGPSLKKKSKFVSGSESVLSRRKTTIHKSVMSKLPISNPGKSLDKMVSGPPYFLYGNVINLSADDWQKVSQFLYALQPEFANTQFYSALNRKEGYIHNLPTEDRFYIEPKSPMTIQELMPHTKKFWPSWDTRKQLSFINSENMGASHICANLGKMLKNSHGVLSSEQQVKFLHYCQTINLVWVGPHQVGPIEPEHLERLLGYPIHHTKNPDMSLVDRVESLRNCFQTDTLGYHLSVLKVLFPGGITLLSLYSGIGGAEVTLHRLGIYLKGVVSIESSETKRKVLRRWWQSTDQTGELVQLEDIQKLTSSKLELLKKKLGDFDLIICQNPCSFSLKGSNKVLPGSSDYGYLDFTMYYEFVRVLQRVRNMAGRA